MTEIPPVEPEEPAPSPPDASPVPSWRSRFRRPTRGQIFRAIRWTALVLFVVFVGLSIYVYRSAVGRFQVRKLRLPTRIYADYMPLVPGAPLQPDDLLEKLDRLGYRETKTLAAPGEYLRSEGGVDIHTREFTHPTGEYPAAAIRVVMSNSQIASVVSLPAMKVEGELPRADKAALEPELLTSVLSEQLENRSPVTLSQVPRILQDAVVATEDVRFWHHPGVDPFGIMRALFRNLKKGGVAEGASTLTQQLVKNYFLTSERTYRRKVTEAFMAVILDARYSKSEILEAYLNDIYLGRNRSISILGVGEASRFYFGKPVAEINLAEAALLAGMIRSPNNYSPFTHPEMAMRRRNTVLQQMLRLKKIDQKQYDEAHSAKLPAKPFRTKSGLSSIPFYVDRVLQELETDYGIDDVKGRGLRIYTAIDLGAQDSAAQIVESSLASLEKKSSRLRRHDPPLQGALIHIDVPTGEIRALVGGRNYERSQFNRALKSKRLVGSLFKPFVYLTAFEPSLSNQNITPATRVNDARFILKRRWSEDWSPRNYDARYLGWITVQRALEESLNAASVRIGLACQIGPIIKTARTLGVQEEMDEDNPSILLGAVGIPPIQMAEAYATIARQGARMAPRAIRFVTDDRGRSLTGHDDTKPVQVFPRRDVYVLTNVMKGVVDRGTAGSARSIGFRKIAAGKTGTTNDKRDAWFIGFTPQTLALTWVGFDDNDPMGLSGSDAAVPMWARYMMAATAGAPNADFAPPEGISFVEVDEVSGGVASAYCPRGSIVSMAFKSGTQPSAPCADHIAPSVVVPMYDQFGNLIYPNAPLPPLTDTTPTSMTPPESTLTGGVFRTETTDTATTTPPPPTTTSEPPPPTDTTTTTNPP